MEGESGKAELHPAAVEAVLAASGREGGKDRASILLVDGDTGSRNLLALRLGNEGYSTRTAADGRTALEEIRREAPGLVLSEAVLPGLDGFALLDTLKREGKGKIPFMFLSSRADPLSTNKGLLLGAVDFIAKPVNFEVLLTKLEKVLAQAVDLSGVSARISLSDVTQVGNTEYPPVSYEELQAGTAILGRFQIESDLGEGGMGKVFKARDERLEEQVVIKVMKPGFSDDILRRFKREIRLARKITHPGVVRIFDFWEAGPLKFVTMEYLEGTDLRAEIKRRGAFPVPVALRVATEIFEALSAAHDVGVVHRDMKPHNVVMLPSGKVKVLDFGIAQGLEPNTPDSATVTGGAILGTPEYMSPEQLMAEKLDPRTDIYSTGVMLYELLTGQLPFPSEDRIAGARMRLVSDPEPPSSKNPNIPENLESLVLRLLQRKRDDRYASAADVVADLNQMRR
jgi:CheY-like chemotaxis protein